MSKLGQVVESVENYNKFCARSGEACAHSFVMSSEVETSLMVESKRFLDSARNDRTLKLNL